MPNRKLVRILILMTAVWCLSKPGLAQSQEGTPSSPAKGDKAPDAAKAQASDRGKSIQPYRLDFSLNELDGGKKTNSRHYSMDLTTGSSNEIRIGTRVPIVSGRAEPGAGANVNTQWQYIDVGTTIWAYLRGKEDSDDWQLEVKSDVSDMDRGAENAIAPIVRQMKFTGTTLLVTGRPIVIATMDDPNSSRQFQLEVTATKLR